MTIATRASGPSYPAGELTTASDRLRALAVLSGSLTDALAPAEAAYLVERDALAVLGASSAVVVTLGAFPVMKSGERVPEGSGTLTVLHGIGTIASVMDTAGSDPLEALSPIAQVARSGEAVFLGSPLELMTYPDWGRATISAGGRAAAIVPVWANGELRGVLALTWDKLREFEADERAFVVTVGVLCAQAIMRAYLRDSELRAREEAEIARAVAESANRAKARFVATISHELRTPMNAVLGYTELLGDGVYGPVSDVQREHLMRVRASGRHLLVLVEDLLGYARVEAGVERLRCAHVDLGTIVTEGVDLVRPLATRKGLEIHVSLPDHPVQLYTDSVKLKQILVNLFANAVKFSVVGDIALVVRLDGMEMPVKVFFEVTDHGIGMTPTEQLHAFEPFWQSDPSVSHREGSTGLGLSVSRQLARLLGGDLVVAQSALGLGSTFVLTLPLRVEPMDTS